MIVYPAVDILDGRCVRLFQGSFEKRTIYANDPAAMAEKWAEEGAEILHVVDLDGAQGGQPLNLEIIGDIIDRVPVPVQVGGGLRSMEVLDRLIDRGAARVVLGTSLVDQPELVEKACSRYGEQVVAAIDVRNGRIATHGWVKQQAYTVARIIGDLRNLGVQRLVYTDISSDGTRRGPAIAQIEKIVAETDLRIIVSGGIASLDDLRQVREFESDGVEGVIVGRALYDGVFSLAEAIEAANGAL